MAPPSILFVCTANVCRSPMAEALFMQKLEQRRLSDPDFPPDWRVGSAGTWASEGEPAALRSQKVMLERGLDLRKHRSRRVTLEILGSYNLILVMEQSHKEALRVEFPGLTRRIFLLGEMAGLLRDVRDPIAGTMADYIDVARELDSLLSQGFERICQLARRKPNP